MPQRCMERSTEACWEWVMSEIQRDRVIGRVERVNGPVVEARGVTDSIMLELVYVGESRLVGEVIKLRGDGATLQVYEDTTGVAPGDSIYGTGRPLSLELGPGLMGNIYDGIQRPLRAIEEISGSYIERGISVPGLDQEREWEFTPLVEVGATVSGGSILGDVPETSRIMHHIMVPQGVEGTVISIVSAGSYKVHDTIAVIQTAHGEKPLTMVQHWAIRNPRPVAKRKPLGIPLITGQRVIDTLFPIPRGGTVAIPGGFGTGKTMTQHAIAKWCNADIIVYIGCGERGNEMTDVLHEFSHLIDPISEKPLLERTILIANTSNMPVSAREASIYTGITLAEYYRDQGYHVAIMADSTSRWAEALRELSGRLEEMPAEEGFPAYLPTRIAEFYERAGLMECYGDREGSVSIIGAVSPQGGDFSEPVTQHTKRFVRCFWGLDRQLANARHYPAISWITSYSEYLGEVSKWWVEQVGSDWSSLRSTMMELLQREIKLQQVVKLVGPDALPDSQRFVLEVCNLFKNAFLQQNAFDTIDCFSTVEKQYKMLELIVTYWNLGSQAIQKGTTLVKIRRMRVLQEIGKMKFNVSNDDLSKIDRLQVKLERSFDKLEAMYG